MSEFDLFPSEPDDNHPTPAPGLLLQQLVSQRVRVQTNQPLVTSLRLLVVLLVTIIAFLALTGLRRDWLHLPVWWRVAGVGLCAVLGVWQAAGVVRPANHQVLPKGQPCARRALLSSALLIVVCTLLTVETSWSYATQHSFQRFTLIGAACLSEVILLGQLFAFAMVWHLRDAVPVAAFGVAFASGTIGGVFANVALHLHCAVGEPVHVGLFHGGSTLLSGLLTWTWARRWLWSSPGSHLPV